ncbi:hypothetical protein ILYODFUR_023024 [Ilyodon furcidens]|uniref:Uncharacterized protein n=1 Tax=Ilyodon furcidens TaxID=33524 RepID=A0ABV0UX65_9TELE
MAHHQEAQLQSTARQLVALLQSALANEVEPSSLHQLLLILALRCQVLLETETSIPMTSVNREKHEVVLRLPDRD